MACAGDVFGVMGRQLGHILASIVQQLRNFKDVSCRRNKGAVVFLAHLCCISLLRASWCRPRAPQLCLQLPGVPALATAAALPLSMLVQPYTDQHGKQKFSKTFDLVFGKLVRQCFFHFVLCRCALALALARQPAHRMHARPSAAHSMRICRLVLGKPRHPLSAPHRLPLLSGPLAAARREPGARLLRVCAQARGHCAARPAQEGQKRALHLA